MKHLHHIIPKHMGGTNEPDNLIELTVEEHAEAHRNLYEKYGNWQDLVAWKGLLGLIDSDECTYISIVEGAKKGAAITNNKRWSNHIKQNRLYEKGIDGRKIRAKRYWFNNGFVEGQFSFETFPEGWKRGRLKKSTQNARNAKKNRSV